MNKFLMIGSDPECFLRDKEGKLVSAIGIIDGTKSCPLKTANGSIQYDGLAAEFNSKPSSNVSDFIYNHKLIINDLELYLAPLDLKLDFITTILATELLSDPNNKEAFISGCESDFDAWNLCKNEPASYLNNDHRCSGGHLHISFDQAVNSPISRLKMVKALDLILGVPSILHDDDKLRRTMYGKAGAFRPKDTLTEEPDEYDGLEYRTLSNFWLKSEELMRFVWNGVELCYNNLEELSEQAIFFKDDIIQIINSGNRDMAESFCYNNGIATA